MNVLWRGTWATRLRISTGLVLMVYVLLHFLNIGLAAISPDWADAMQRVRLAVMRSPPGTLLLYGSLAVHAGLALGRLARRGTLRLTAQEWLQTGLGLAIPFLLATHVTFTRASHGLFGTHDTVSYLSGLIWTSTDGWLQALLVLITWGHGCLGLHMWLRLTPWWPRWLPGLMFLATLVPAIALAGFMTEGRRVRAILNGPDEDAALDFYDDTNWPGPGEFAELRAMDDASFWVICGILGLTLAAHLLRRVLRPRRSLRIAYVDGPEIRAAPGPTLLEISKAAGVPHTSLCGGRGRCSTCRVIFEEGGEDLPPPTPAEAATLAAVQAPPGARLACQVRPASSARVFRVFRPGEGRPARAHATQGYEAQLAVLFLDMRGFTARTTGQLPYDVVFLLNRFFDAIVPAIARAGGRVDKYMGDGLMAVFDARDAARSAQAGLAAVDAMLEALAAFNATLAQEGSPPVQIGIGLHLGHVVIGEIGAEGSAPRTLIGEAVNTASRLESLTKDMGAVALISTDVLHAAGRRALPDTVQQVTLRGLAMPVDALPIPQGETLSALLEPLRKNASEL